ncbi:MAG TPA: tyrosine-protein phosphatase [Gemmatales bacterium]|mgnify:CR=1 FL=1|nr:tyrosine-protein phosphatase [Gemmatales bacterium]HMP58878.1 tyrosine-protein phosphatase [Gemmatales bacterium]
MLARLLPRLAAAALVAVTVAVPAFYYRSQYDTAKRLRVVTPGKVYRSGQLTAATLTDLVRREGIRTVINVQNELPNPVLDNRQDEAHFVESLGARYVFIDMDLLERHRIPAERPAAVEAFLQVMDDPAAYPVLIHCRAGLHRTGTLVALYRLEYEREPLERVMRELIANGFGTRQATARNDYIRQYLLTYQPRPRSASDAVRLNPEP